MCCKSKDPHPHVNITKTHSDTFRLDLAAIVTVAASRIYAYIPIKETQTGVPQNVCDACHSDLQGGGAVALLPGDMASFPPGVCGKSGETGFLRGLKTTSRVVS